MVACGKCEEETSVMATARNVQQFRRNGFVNVSSFFSTDETAELSDNVDRFVRDIVPRVPREHVFYEDKTDAGSLKQIQEMFAYDDYFHELMFGSRFEKLAADLLDNEVIGVNLQYFNKPAGTGMPTPPHQDGYYFMLEPNEAVTMWMALEDVDEENGCVRYVPGSHRHGLRAHARTKTLGFSQGMTDFGPADKAIEIACPARPGDLLVHHALTIHRADGNSSRDRSRKAIGLIYYSKAARESEHKADRQRQLMNELRQSGKL